MGKNARLCLVRGETLVGSGHLVLRTSGRGQGSPEALATGENRFLLDLGTPATQGKYTFFGIGLARLLQANRLLQIFGTTLEGSSLIRQ